MNNHQTRPPKPHGANARGAPPVYRPVPAVQRPKVNSPSAVAQLSAFNVRPAPPVYRATAQPKMSPSTYAAPPIYSALRPVAPQPKALVRSGSLPAFPPVYRPFAVMQRMEDSGTDDEKELRPKGGGRDSSKEKGRDRTKPYSFRHKTEENSKKTKTIALAGGKPANRSRRNSATYANVDLFELHGEAPNAELNRAIAARKIWSGFRAAVSWSTGFADRFWARTDSGGGTWACSHRYDNCRQPNLAAGHAQLEIGHITGFYNQIVGNVDPVVVCDGRNHWEVMLYGDVVSANEAMGNLQPQCTTCNRDPRQKRKDDEGSGKYRPEQKGTCPGARCRETKISDL